MRFPHLNGRADKLADSLDLPANLAEWLAVTALHSGCFLRSQYCDFYHHSRVAANKFIHRLVKQNLIFESPAESLGLLSRVTNKAVYRLLDAGDIRHRRMASWPLMFRRLLCLDYVLDRPELPWLPTEEEKLACFARLDVPREDLPFREYRGAENVGHTRRFFANKHPIAVDARAMHAVFVYADSEEKSPQGVRSWRKEHAALWSNLHRLGFRLEIVHAGFNTRLAESVSRVFTSWQHAPQSPHSNVEVENELALVQDAIRSNDKSALRIYGGFNGALRASAALKKRLRQQSDTSAFSATYRVWLSERIAQAASNPNPCGSREVNH